MDVPEDASGYSRVVKEAEDAVLRGLTSSGPAEIAAATALCEAEELSPWITTNAAGQKALNFHGADQNQIGRSLLEQSLRNNCATLIKAAEENGEKAMLYRHCGAPDATLPRLLDLAVYLGSQRQIDAALVFTLMEDVISMTTITDAEGVFDYLESRILKLRQVYNFAGATAHSKLSVLKICNQLLLRLSRASSSELCGRILMFLTRLLPLLDRSGLNVLGQFNTSHSTPVEEVAEGEVDSNGEPIDAAFYSSFWGLQAVFQQPYSAIEPSKWTSTIADIKRVLAEFTKQPVALASSSGGGGGSVQEDVQLTVKYLASRKLIRLQLQDAALRRHFLLQALIFLHACQNPVVKKDQQRRDALRSKQVLEAEELQGLLYAELQSTPKHGSEFAAAVKTILSRETRWAKWKSENCEDWTKDRREPAKLSPLPLHPQLQRLSEPKPSRTDVGSDTLNRLWNITRDNTSCLKAENRRKTPSLQEFLEPVIVEMDPEEAVEEMYKTKKDALYQWKALRMIARTSLPVFSKMLGPVPSKARKGKDADKKEAASEVRAKLDLEDAVHELLPSLVPEGAKRRPALPPASAPASAAPSDAEPSSRTDADAAAVTSAPAKPEGDAPQPMDVDAVAATSEKPERDQAGSADAADTAPAARDGGAAGDAAAPVANGLPEGDVPGQGMLGAAEAEPGRMEDAADRTDGQTHSSATGAAPQEQECRSLEVAAQEDGPQEQGDSDGHKRRSKAEAPRQTRASKRARTDAADS